jgi:hypothetical protein
MGQLGRVLVVSGGVGRMCAAICRARGNRNRVTDATGECLEASMTSQPSSRVANHRCPIDAETRKPSRNLNLAICSSEGGFAMMRPSPSI